MDRQNHNPSFLIRILRPIDKISILLGSLLYSAGAGVSDYMGNRIDWLSFWIGILIIASLQITSWFLKECFTIIESTRIGDSNPKWIRDQRFFMQSSLLFIVLNGLWIYILCNHRVFNIVVFSLIGLTIFSILVFSIPPFQLSKKGFGEITQAIIASTLAPMLGIVLQTGEIHRFAALLAFPFFLMMTARGLALALPNFAEEMKNGFNSMMGKLGWQTGMNVHNILTLTAFVIIGLLPWLGFNWGIIWPVMLCFPLALLQIWQMVQISAGSKPKWRSLILIANTLPLTAAYLVVFGLWMR